MEIIKTIEIRMDERDKKRINRMLFVTGITRSEFETFSREEKDYVIELAKTHNIKLNV